MAHHRCAWSSETSLAVPARLPRPLRLDRTRQGFCREFFGWYNGRHRHSGIGLMTPATVHHGRAEQAHAERARVLDAAYAATPERFIRRAPTPPPVPVAAWINKPDIKEAAH